MAWSHFCACGTRLSEEGTVRDQEGNNFCPPGYGKINRGITVKSKIGFRCLEEAAVGEFSPSEEGSKPTPHLISSHSKVFLELRHRAGTRPPSPAYLHWPRAQLLHWHRRKKPEATQGPGAPISEYHLTLFCSEDLPTAEDLQLGTYSAQPPATLSWALVS